MSETRTYSKADLDRMLILVQRQGQQQGFDQGFDAGYRKGVVDGHARGYAECEADHKRDQDRKRERKTPKVERAGRLLCEWPPMPRAEVDSRMAERGISPRVAEEAKRLWGIGHQKRTSSTTGRKVYWWLNGESPQVRRSAKVTDGDQLTYRSAE